MNKSPIGVFDSGLGGLSVLKEIIRLLPNEDIVYLGDTARVPYGTRSKSVVTKFAMEDIRFLQKMKVKCIVIACNTASAIAGKKVKKQIKLPVFEVISSGAHDAAKTTKNGKIGVMATRGTINSNAYSDALKKIDKSFDVYSESCPLLVPLIEEMEVEGAILNSLLDRYLRLFLDKEVDTLILGCTHYPIIAGEIKKKLKGVKLINPGVFLAENLKDFLLSKGISNSPKTKGKVSYFVTDLNPRFLKVSEMFLGKKLGASIKEVSLE